jgi:hypothetical protein
LAVRQDREPEDLLASRTLAQADWELVANKGARRGSNSRCC